MHGRASRTAGYPLPRCRKAGRGARTPICCGAQWCGLELMSSARAKRRASQHRDRIAGMTPTKPSAPGPGSAHQPRPNPMACGVEQPRWRADLTALPALSVVHWHGSSSGGSRRPLPLYHGGSDVPLAVTPAAPSITVARPLLTKRYPSFCTCSVRVLREIGPERGTNR
jgi:hypothetical protein